MKAFIFDLDGVIVDTAKYHFIAWKRIGEKVGFTLTHEQNESLKGVSRVESLDRILAWAKEELTQEEKERLLIEKNQDYLAQIDDMGQEEILPGVLSIDFKDFILSLSNSFATFISEICFNTLSTI